MKTLRFLFLLFCLLLLASQIFATNKNADPPTPHYTGEPLTLNFQDVEVKSVIRLLADFSKINLVTSESVIGNITLQLQDIPWDQALDIILKSKGLAKRQIGEVLLIGTVEEIATREKLELQAKQNISDLAPIRTDTIMLSYAKAKDLASLLKTEKNSLLSSRGAVSVDERTNTLLIQDIETKLAQVRALVTRLDMPVKQVLIESRVVFVNDNVEEALGVTFRSVPKNSETNPSLALKDRLNVNLSTVLPSGANNMAHLGLAVAKLPKGTLLDLELMALENEGLGKIVASPRLVTSDQQEAYIESGEEIPYQETTSSGATSVAFKKAVLRLEVTPQITPDHHIILDLKVNQDSRGAVTNGVPAINMREMHTKVLVADGETVVLGGIYQQNQIKNKMRVPFLGKVPLLGWLFKNEIQSDQRNELLIFVTPNVITGR
ncbi:MAG: type IV pilus secretin PilQ [Candidatus Berkiellales bacterium]